MIECNEIKLFDGWLYFKGEERVDLTLYPDGQRNIIPDENLLKLARKYNLIDGNREAVIITTSICTFKDFECLFCLVSFLRNNDVFIDHIKILYLMGCRSDRKFSSSGISYLKQVIFPQLEILNCNIKIMNPHNILPFYELRTPFYIECFQIPSVYKLIINRAVMTIGADEHANAGLQDIEDLPSFYFEKKRENGKIKICGVKQRYLDRLILKNESIIIIDDLCDGGGTFLAIADYLKDYSAEYESLSLYISHAIFSSDKNIELLSKAYKNIYFTNSYKSNYEGLPSNFHMIDVRGI